MEGGKPLLPGWYPDPAGGTGKWYWDGNDWRTAIPSLATAPAKKPYKFVLPVVAVAVILGIMLAVANLYLGGDKASSSNTQLPTRESQRGPLDGLRSPLMGIEMPGGADLRSLLNDFTKDGIPNRMERWSVPLSFDNTVAAMKSTLHPYTSSFDGIPWLQAATEVNDTSGHRYVDWWWGRGSHQPLILVRVQEYDGEPTTTVTFERRD